MPPIPSDPHSGFHEYLAWDVPTRWFHWINALAVIGLMATGIMILSDDVFGRLFADWIAAPGVDPGAIQPGASDLVDKIAYQSMRDFRGPFVEIHEITFYVLAIAVVLHLIAVVVTELHEGGGITSAMFTGRKILTGKPPDAP